MRVSSSASHALAALTMPLLAAAPEGSPGPEGSTGAVHTMAGDDSANGVVSYRRAANGRVTEIGRFATGGSGTGVPRLGSHGSVVLVSACGDALGSLVTRDDPLQQQQTVDGSNREHGDLLAAAVAPSRLEKRCTRSDRGSDERTPQPGPAGGRDG